MNRGDQSGFCFSHWESHMLVGATENRTPKLLVLLLSAALFTDTLLYDMVAPFLPGIVKSQYEGTPAAIGLLFGAYALGLLAATPLMAFLAHRFSSRGPLVCGLLGLASSMALLGSGTHYVALFAGRLLEGIAGAAIWTASLALLAENVPADRRGSVMGMALGVASIGTLVGFPMGGILYDWGGFEIPFLVGGALALALAALFRLAGTANTRAPEPFRPLCLLTDRSYLATAGVVVIGAAILTMLEPLLPLHLGERLGMSPHEIGLMFVPALVAYGAATPLAGWIADRSGRRSTMALGLSITAFCLPLVALPHSWIGEVCVLIPIGIGCALLLTPCLPELADAVDRRQDGSYGLAYAFFNLAYAVGMLGGPLFGGLAASGLGFLGMLALFGTVSLAWVPVLISKEESHGALPRRRDRSPAAQLGGAIPGK
jgi:DHA1 family solute carrier family 18 vesicular amine transporter 1/2